MTAVLTSAAGVLSLLDEPEQELQGHALQELDKMVHNFWSEIAPVVTKIEELYEDETFNARGLAAVVASKVFYHLEELDDALRYALGAGTLFDIEERTEYVQTMVSKCIEDYIAVRMAALDAKEEPVVDARMEGIVERMFDRCYADGTYKQAFGIAVESRRIDHVEKAIVISGDVPGMLAYGFNVCTTHIQSRDFRHSVLRVLVKLYRSLPEPDYVSMCQSLLFLDDHAAIADVLNSLVESDPLMAFQVGFDLYDNQNQPFLVRVIKALPAVEALPAAAADGDAVMAVAGDAEQTSMQKLVKILNGETPINLYLHFLYEHNHSDLNILKLIKDKLEARNSVTHNATVLAHAIMHCGTTVDVFLRDNLEWLGRATNWAKFTATASIGVIHKGHHKESMKLLEPYLPKDGVQGSPYQEGGALYALGLIHANHGGAKTEFLLNALQGAGTNEIVQHGACLGLGLTAMSTGNEAVYEEIKAVVFTESAVAGQAAGLAMGLVMLGSGHGEALEEMRKYAHETQHDRIVRGLAMGMALIVYGREEEADALIEDLIRDQNPILRYGGCYAIAMAYAATENNAAIRKLLHVAVSDVSDDVRRAAVTALGFVLASNPDQVPKVVSLLAESYNPHVRYGACMAVGIACAGMAHAEALKLLEPLLSDRVDFVRQAAFIASSMVLVQASETTEPRVKALRKKINESVAVKGDTMTKLGAILGAGILDAGGRNQTMSVMSAAGHKKMGAMVGMAIFPQFWYWYPECLFISLTFSPTTVIGLNKNLKMPKAFAFKSHAKPSVFAYPPPVSLRPKEEKKNVKKATLSVAKKAARARSRRNADGTLSLERSMSEMSNASSVSPRSIASSPRSQATEGDEDTEMKTGDKKEDKKEDKKKEEPLFELLSNPCRVTEKQRAVCVFEPSTGDRYTPVKKQLFGIVMLKDNNEGEAEDLVTPKPPKIGVPGVSDDEPNPPAPFEFTRPAATS